jgi:hypothetical protein
VAEHYSLSLFFSLSISSKKKRKRETEDITAASTDIEKGRED